MRTAIEWSLSGENAEAGLRLAAALSKFWIRRLSAGREWLTETLKKTVNTSTSTKAKALCGAGTMLRRAGDIKEARALLAESLSIYQTLDDKLGIASALNELGIVDWYEGHYASARTLHEQALIVYRELGHTRGEASALIYLGELDAVEGYYASARSRAEEAQKLVQELGDRRAVTITIQDLGWIDALEGHYVSARRFLEKSLSRFQESGERRGVAIDLNRLGVIDCLESHFTPARLRLEEGLRISQEYGGKVEALQCLNGLAELACAQKDHDRAVRLFGAVEAGRAAIGFRPGPGPASRTYGVAAARTVLGDAAFAAAWAEGRAMTLEQAIEYALATGTT